MKSVWPKMNGERRVHFSDLERGEVMLLKPEKKREKGVSSFFSDVLIGWLIGIPILWLCIIENRKMPEGEETLFMENMVLLCSLFADATLHMLMYAANLYFWRRFGFNYSFIFGFKGRTALNYRDVIFLSIELVDLALTSFLLLNLTVHKYHLQAELFPLGLFSVVFIILFCPFNIIHQPTRAFFIERARRCICATFYEVTFPDFFFAEQLTSQVQAVRIICFYMYYYGYGQFSDGPNKFFIRGDFNTLYFIVAIIPYWIRCLQSHRRWCEEKLAVYRYNGLKDFSTIVAIISRTIFEYRKGMTWKLLVIISSATALVFNTYWDIVVDWGFLPGSRVWKNWIESHKRLCFFSVVINILLRVAWLQLVLQFDVLFLSGSYTCIVITCLEIVRRGIWNFFRLVNEQWDNVGRFRSFRFMPVPISFFWGEVLLDDDDLICYLNSMFLD